MKPPRKKTARLLWTLFSIFVVYGTAFPFRFQGPPGHFHRLLRRINWLPLGGIGSQIQISDIIQNILLFMPFGFLGYFSLIHKSSRLRKLTIVLMGCALSASVEFLQIFAPTRFPALSDVIFNTTGTAVGVVLGVLLKKSVLGFKSHPVARKLLDAPSAFPAVVFSILVVAGCWEPFDFSLDVGIVWSHVKPLLHHFVSFKWPDDDLVSFIRFLLASLFICRLLKEAGVWTGTGWRRPGILGVLIVAILGVVLEGTQIIIASRMPELQDALVAVLGAIAGGIVFLFPGFREKPWLWSVAATSAIFTSAVVRGLHPFHFARVHSGFNWVLFLPQYQHTTFAALGDFLESGMVFFPLGFLIRYFFPRARYAAVAALLLSGALAFAVEAAEGWVEGRYSDVTDVFGAVLGSLAGSLVLTRGWVAFIAYMREDEDTQV